MEKIWMNKQMKAVLYSKENCQWCDRARMLLDSVNIDYLEYKYEKDFTKQQFQMEFGGEATFPQVNIGNQYIGGFKDTLHFLKENEII